MGRATWMDQGAGADSEPDAAWPPRAWPARRRRFRPLRMLRRLVLLCFILVIIGALAFGGLLLITPSVSNARDVAKSIDAAHNAAYPGVSTPYRFSTALEATEDHRFTSEPGVDPFAVARVAVGYLTGKGDQGGATLYQQLAKMLYTPGRAGIDAEAEQVALAVKLKYSYSQAEILRLYSDVAYFGHGFYGLQAASCGYFGVQPAEMSWPQAALLAGLVQAPSNDDPLANPAAGRVREQHVVGRLVAIGVVTSGQASSYLAIPLSRLLAHAGSGCS